LGQGWDWVGTEFEPGWDRALPREPAFNCQWPGQAPIVTAPSQRLRQDWPAGLSRASVAAPTEALLWPSSSSSRVSYQYAIGMAQSHTEENLNLSRRCGTNGVLSLPSFRHHHRGPAAAGPLLPASAANLAVVARLCRKLVPDRGADGLCQPGRATNQVALAGLLEPPTFGVMDQPEQVVPPGVPYQATLMHVLYIYELCQFNSYSKTGYGLPG